MRIVLRFLLALAFAGPSTLAAQTAYRLGLDTANATWQVEGRIQNPDEEDLELWIARWTAGAYHLAEYGRFIEDFSATDGTGNELAVERVSDSQFKIGANGADEVVIRYQAASISSGLFSNDVIDVESNRITEDYAYVTPVSLFGFVPDQIEQPISLTVDLPAGWQVATILDQDDAGGFQAPSYYRFEDSPLFFAPDLQTFELEAGGKPLAVTVYGKDDDEARATAEMCERIVEAAAKLMRGLPYDRYRFLFGFVPESDGASGLEHSFSTLILCSEGMTPRATASIAAHEFFHLWCAERIHVEAIHTPDYTQELETGTLWVNEGVTEYVTQHILLHAGYMGPEQFVGQLGSSMRMPGQGEHSWTDISRMAAGWEGMNDLMRWSVAMYMQGPRTIFALDLEMRRATNGERGVIDLVHHLVDEYVEKDRGFPEDGMIDIVNHVAGSDLTGFYERFIDGSETPDLSEYLDVIGYAIDGGRVQEVEEPSELQLKTRADLFSSGE